MISSGIQEEIVMATITAGEFRNGKVFEMEGKYYQVVEFQHVKPGKGAAYNNLANFETWTFFKWVFKTFLAVTLISNTFNTVSYTHLPQPQRMDYRAGRKTEGAAYTKSGGGSDTSSQSADEVYGDTKGRTEGLDKGWTEPGDFTGLKGSQRSSVPVSYTHLDVYKRQTQSCGTRRARQI